MWLRIKIWPLLLIQEVCRHRADILMNRNCCRNIELWTLMQCLNNVTLNDSTLVQLVIWKLINRVLIKFIFNEATKENHNLPVDYCSSISIDWLFCLASFCCQKSYVNFPSESNFSLKIHWYLTLINLDEFFQYNIYK